jgi:hypothetical protein
MNERCRKLLLVLAVLGLFGPLSAQSSRKRFVVVQAMAYRSGHVENMMRTSGLDLTKDGVPEAQIIFESTLLPSAESDAMQPDTKLRAFAAGLKKGPIPIVIDIERWPANPADSSKRAEHVHRLADVIDKLRSLRPDLRFGFYGVLPERVYWPLVDSSRIQEEEQWQRYNRLAKVDLAPHVDAVFPSLYTFYPDEKGWERFAVRMLEAAHQFGKPVYCFLWPKYVGEQAKNGYLPRRYWRLELDTCHKYADGIVLYDESTDKDWDPSAPWWKETQDFLATLDAR